MTLRPIGTEFDVAFPPSQTCSDPAWNVFTYRVAAHSTVKNETGGLSETETLDVVALKKYRSEQCALWMGQFQPVPPKEILSIVGPGWLALYEHVNGKASGLSDDRSAVDAQR